MKFGKRKFFKTAILMIFNLIFLSANLMILSSTNIFSAVHWANRVIESSGYNNVRGYSPNCYSPMQALGKPSVMPDFGETVCAWSPRALQRNDFLILGFPERIYAEQIAIAENINPGAIVKITLFGEGKDLMVFSNSDPQPIQRWGRMFNIYFDRTDFRVERIRIDINTFKYNIPYQIDAVAISDSKTPIELKINLSDDVMEVSDPENLGGNINSPHSELAPVIAPDGKTIYYTRERFPGDMGRQNIWFAEMDRNGKFLPAQNIGEPLNTRFNNFVISILPDGNSMLVGNTYFPDGRVGGGFSMTYRKGKQWSFPEAVQIRNFYNSAPRGSYCLGSCGRVLISSIQRNDTYGGNDLYVSFLQNNGIWSEPMNLGTDINSADREDSPFLAADGVTLYYSTSGRPGYGSNDIFMSRRLDDTWKRWSEPVNLGPKINTKEWDAYFTITASGDYAYFVSSQNSIGNEDIFRVKLPAQLRPEKVVLVSGKVIDRKTRKPVEAVIYYENLTTGESIGIARSNPVTGEYKIALAANERYGFRAEASSYIPINENLDLTKLKTDVLEIARDLVLVPIEQGQALTINNVFFEFGQFELLPASYPELERLAKLMAENPRMRIRLEGHTDNVGTAQSNMSLSNARVEAVKNFLVSKGVNESRIQLRGLGRTKPIATNNTEEGRAKNRRVECIILSN